MTVLLGLRGILYIYFIRTWLLLFVFLLGEEGYRSDLCEFLWGLMAVSGLGIFVDVHS